MAEQNDKKDDQTSPPPEIEVPFHGSVRKVALAEAVKLAGIGMQDQFRRDELKRMQDELKAKGDAQAAQLQVGQRLSQFAAANPAGARAVDQVYLAIAEGKLTPEQVLGALGGGGTSEANGTAAPTSAPQDVQTRAALAALEAKLDGVASSVEARAKAEAERARNTEIDQALGRDTFLRTRPKAAELVRDRISSRMATSGLSLPEAVTLEVATFKAALEEEKSAERDKLLEREALGTVQTSRGAPPVAAPDYSKIPPTALRPDRRRMMLDAIKERAMEYAHKARQGVVSGPS